jgi:flagellar assembly protein FliH
MSRPLALEDFGARPADRSASPQVAGPEPAALEEERLKAFEKGYGAGWEDAARAHAEEQDAISADFARSLQGLSFTFHEAQAAFLRDVEGVLAGLVEQVLPNAVAPSLARLVGERVRARAVGQAVRVEIVVAPENVARVERLADGRPGPPLDVKAEPSLGPGQAFLRFGSAEEQIDLDGALSELREALLRFLEDPEAAAEPVSGRSGTGPAPPDTEAGQASADGPDGISGPDWPQGGLEPDGGRRVGA